MCEKYEKKYVYSNQQSFAKQKIRDKNTTLLIKNEHEKKNYYQINFQYKNKIIKLFHDHYLNMIYNLFSGPKSPLPGGLGRGGVARRRERAGGRHAAHHLEHIVVAFVRHARVQESAML